MPNSKPTSKSPAPAAGTGNDNNLAYFISSNLSVCVVVFAGSFSRECIPTLEKCQKELLEKSPRKVVLVLRDVSTRVEIPLFPVIGRFFKAIRDVGADMRLCSVHPELKSLMDSKGLLRVEELDNNLNDSLARLRVFVRQP